MDFLWQFADDSIRELIQALAARKFFKRIFEVHIGELGDRIDYATVKAELSLERRVGKTSSLQKRLFLAVENSMRERGPGDSIAENAARERLEVVRQNSMPQIIVDFPSRGVPSEMNLPKEIGDPERKYFVMSNRTKAADNVFNVVKRLQEQQRLPLLHVTRIRA